MVASWACEVTEILTHTEEAFLVTLNEWVWL